MPQRPGGELSRSDMLSDAHWIIMLTVPCVCSWTADTGGSDATSSVFGAFPWFCCTVLPCCHIRSASLRALCIW